MISPGTVTRDNDNADVTMGDRNNGGSDLTAITSMDGTPNNDDEGNGGALSSCLFSAHTPSSTTSMASSPSAISPEARRIASALLVDDDNSISDDVSNDENAYITNSNNRELPLGVPPPLDDDDDDDEEIQESSHHHHHHSLPDVEELKMSVLAAKNKSSSANDDNSSSYKTKKIILIAVLTFLFFLAVILGFVLGVTEGRNNNNSNNYDDDESKQQQLQNQQQNTFGGDSNSDKEYRLRSLQDYFVKHGVTSGIDFDNSITMNSPQFQAVRWLANQDYEQYTTSLDLATIGTSQKDLTTREGYELVTRYIMAVLFYSTKGKNWDSELNFLNNNKPTCEWYEIFPPPIGQVGVLCDQNTKKIIGLSLSKFFIIFVSCYYYHYQCTFECYYFNFLFRFVGISMP
jgi:hypothetical protein